MANGRQHCSFLFILIGLYALLAGTSRAADVLARYNFNGRTPPGEITLRTCSACPPYNGEDYIPSALAGECGPVLENPGPGGRHYRSKYNNNGSEESRGRQTLFLDHTHSFCLDHYRSKWVNVLPASGSFTWEIKARIDGFDGCDHQGILMDATRGEGRSVNWETQKFSVVTRLWLSRKIADKEPKLGDVYLLNFAVPINDRNQAVNISVELKFGEWHHLAAVYDDNAHKSMLYVDGMLKAWGNVTSSPERSTGFGIGGYGPEITEIKHAWHLQKSYLDEIAFSKGALTPDTFATLIRK